MDLIGILVAVLIVGVLWWAVNALAGAFGLPAPIVIVLQVVIVILALIYLLRAMGVGGRLGLG